MCMMILSFLIVLVLQNPQVLTKAVSGTKAHSKFARNSKINYGLDKRTDWKVGNVYTYDELGNLANTYPSN